MRDPWRAPDPRKTPAKKPESRRIALEDKDWDADTRPALSCPLRFRTCTIEVRSRDVQSEGDAIRLLEQCVAGLRAAGLGPALDEARVGAGPVDSRPRGASCLSCGGRAVWFVGRTLDDGARELAKLLSSASRHPAGGPIVRRYGITAMLRA